MGSLRCPEVPFSSRRQRGNRRYVRGMEFATNLVSPNSWGTACTQKTPKHLRRVEAGSSATPGVARTCTREQPIEDIGSTGRVHESSRLSMAKLKLNGVSNVCQTCQGDVNMPPEGQRCKLKHGRETQAIYNVCQTCQGDVNMPPEGQKCKLKHGRETQAIYQCQTCQGDA